MWHFYGCLPYVQDDGNVTFINFVSSKNKTKRNEMKPSLKPYQPWN